jgi:hypothetical protein
MKKEREKIMSNRYFDLAPYWTIEMDFDKAAEIIKHRGNGNLLKGMQSMQQLWNDYCMTDLSDMYEDDDEFYDEYEYEMNAYNVVHENMSKLFV